MTIDATPAISSSTQLYHRSRTTITQATKIYRRSNTAICYFHLDFFSHGIDGSEGLRCSPNRGVSA